MIKVYFFDDIVLNSRTKLFTPYFLHIAMANELSFSINLYVHLHKIANKTACSISGLESVSAIFKLLPERSGFQNLIGVLNIVNFPALGIFLRENDWVDQK